MLYTLPLYFLSLFGQYHVSGSCSQLIAVAISPHMQPHADTCRHMQTHVTRVTIQWWLVLLQDVNELEKYYFHPLMTLCEVIGQNNQSLSSSLQRNNTLTYEDCRQMCATDDKTFATLLVRKAVNYKINRFIARSNRSNLFCAIYFFRMILILSPSVQLML